MDPEWVFLGRQRSRVSGQVIWTEGTIKMLSSSLEVSVDHLTERRGRLISKIQVIVLHSMGASVARLERPDLLVGTFL